MHEVSLMHNLLEAVASAAAREGVKSVEVIHLRIGEMAGVTIDSLSFAFDILSKGTPAEGGRLEFETVPLRGRCGACGSEFRPEDLVFRCPVCGCTDITMTAGREMEIDYICIDEEGDSEGAHGA